MSIKIIHTHSLPWQEVTAENFSYGRKQLGVPAGGEMLGASLYKLMPNAKAFPYHFHYANEEAIFVLEGEGTLRVANEKAKVIQGDYIAIPKGRENPHQMINTSDKPLIYLCFSTMIAPDVMEYPDSKKVGIMAGSAPGGDKAKQLLKAFYKKDQQVEYYEGE